MCCIYCRKVLPAKDNEKGAASGALWDIEPAANVRFQGNNGHDADGVRCLLMTQRGLYQHRLEILRPF